eukprot:354831-Chlamydomonas_euryale.AAC.1
MNGMIDVQLDVLGGTPLHRPRFPAACVPCLLPPSLPRPHLPNFSSACTSPTLLPSVAQPLPLRPPAARSPAPTNQSSPLQSVDAAHPGRAPTTPTVKRAGHCHRHRRRHRCHHRRRRWQHDTGPAALLPVHEGQASRSPPPGTRPHAPPQSGARCRPSRVHQTRRPAGWATPQAAPPPRRPVGLGETTQLRRRRLVRCVEPATSEVRCPRRLSPGRRGILGARTQSAQQPAEGRIRAGDSCCGKAGKGGGQAKRKGTARQEGVEGGTKTGRDAPLRREGTRL